jgi:predicted transcriptional regulator
MSAEENFSDVSSSWTFLSNYAHVLVCLNRDPHQTLRTVALKVGITERAVQRIVGDLVNAEVINKQRDGRRNRYKINTHSHLRHPLEETKTVGELLDFLGQ